MENKLSLANLYLSVTGKTICLGLFLLLLPSILNEIKWLLAGKSAECRRVQAEYVQLVMSSSMLNKHAFAPGEGSSINQVFLGAVLSSATQAPNAKLIQAAIYGCPTVNLPVQSTRW
jgi:hypothetical protein